MFILWGKEVQNGSIAKNLAILQNQFMRHMPSVASIFKD